MDRISPTVTSGHAFLAALKDFDGILRLGWLPALVVALVNLLVMLLVPEDAGGPGPAEIGAGHLLAYLAAAAIQVAMLAVFAVAWHRRLLFGEAPAGRIGGIRFGRREVLYLVVVLAYMAVMLAAVLMTGGPGAAPNPGAALVGIVVVLGAVYLASRVSLVLPAVAADRAPDIAYAWQATKGNAWPLVAVLLLVMLPTLTVQLLLEMLRLSVMNQIGGPVVILVAGYVQAILNYALTAPGLAAITYAYMLLWDRSLRPNLPAPAQRFLR